MLNDIDDLKHAYPQRFYQQQHFQMLSGLKEHPAYKIEITFNKITKLHS